MKRIVESMVAFALVLSASQAFGADAVVVESRQVPGGATGVTVGVYIENDDDLYAVVLPFVIREVTAGSYIADTLALIAVNRLANYLQGFVVPETLPGEDNDRFWMCGGGGFGERGAPDFISPDAVTYMAVRSTDSCLPSGNDGSPPGGTPSLQFTFNFISAPATFEIDTTCVTPNNNLVFVACADWEPTVPSFTKGVIEIGCACDCHGDPVCDTVMNVLDIVAAIDVKNGGDPIPDPNAFCPAMTTDVDCDGDTDQTDVDKITNVAFYSADPEDELCDPCDQ